MLKIGDKVKMTPRGFRFYANLDIQFDMVKTNDTINQNNFEEAICEQFSIHGIGVVKDFNSFGEPYIRWELSIDGMKYHYTHYFEKKDVKKLSLLDKVKFFLRSCLC